jgi:hypothetical protein
MVQTIVKATSKRIFPAIFKERLFSRYDDVIPQWTNLMKPIYKLISLHVMHYVDADDLRGRMTAKKDLLHLPLYQQIFYGVLLGWT